MPGSTHHRPPFVHTSTSFAGTYEPLQQSTSSQSSSSSSSTSGNPSHPHTTTNVPIDPPYTDYPPEKAESDSRSYSPEHTYPSTGSSFRQQNNPVRGIYGYRRSPIQLQQSQIDLNHSNGNGYPGGRWRSAVMARLGMGSKEGQNGGGAGGGLGRALIIGWVVTTLMFVLATAFWKGELFTALDNLSNELRDMGYQGQAIFGFLIFLTTIPPLPLYSTLMVLSGYTFGATQGFMISYLASLIGAVLVFVGSRTLLRDCITKCLSSSPTSMSLLQIIPSRPDLLLLIRIAPYPYNLLNVVLASAQNLSLKTYTGCTAISLLKVILHTWFGSGIHDLSELHSRPPPPPPPGSGHHHHPPHGSQDGKGNAFGHPHPHPHHGDPREDVKFYGTWGGIVLCIFLFVYLHHIAKKALARAQAEAERDGRAEEGTAEGLVQVRMG